MADLINLISALAGERSNDERLRNEVAAHVDVLRASVGRGNRKWVYAAEQAVAADPTRAFSFDETGIAELTDGRETWCAGRFATPSIGELRRRCTPRSDGTPGRRLRLFVLDGASPATDIGGLQATSSEGTLFQVASQFNCLESPGPYVTDVTSYFTDATQGPRASISAFPATLLRHYAAPAQDGTRFTQKTHGRQIELLADALGPGASRNGYFTGAAMGDPQSVVAALSDRFEQIRVGVHDEAQVVLGYNWDGAVGESATRRIAQVFTSTVAGGMYGGERALGSAFPDVCRQLLRAAYLGTLLAAVSLDRPRVVLTLIGGGVFCNPVPLIFDSIVWAMREVEPLLAQDLDVVLNGYSLGSMIDLKSSVLPAVRNRGGAIVRFDYDGISNVLR